MGSLAAAAHVDHRHCERLVCSIQAVASMDEASDARRIAEDGLGPRAIEYTAALQ
jgi:hypothetical protein